MDYSPFSTLLLTVFTDFGLQVIIILGAGVLLAGGVFLIRWGFRVSKNSLNGNLETPVYGEEGWTFKGEFHPYKKRTEK